MALVPSYTFQDTFFHRLDPRTKLVWLVAMLVLVFGSTSIAVPVGLTAVVLVSFWAARLDLRSLAPMAKLVGSLAIGIFLVQGLFHSGGDVLFQLGPLGLHTQGLRLAAQVVAQLFCMFLLCVQFLTWTHPTDLSLVLVKARVPYRYAMLVGLALRFLPVLEEELREILEAQQARGVDLRGSLRRGLAMVPIVVPFCLRTLRRSNEVALAMELRGYGFRPHRTFVRTIRYRPIDYAVSAGLVMCVVAFFVGRAFYPAIA
ncbi:MAG: energy-coupling factor transporter transmembrane protein EcfT [Chloroflexota bacterium]|nr:MAG: energy-coupling factor transporter transmembrane protein EcfT [Chloroflexota bacterium]